MLNARVVNREVVTGVLSYGTMLATYSIRLKRVWCLATDNLSKKFILSKPKLGDLRGTKPNMKCNGK